MSQTVENNINNNIESGHEVVEAEGAVYGNEVVGEGHEEEGEEITLYAEPVFHIGTFPVTNSLLTSWVAVILIIIFSIAVRLKLAKIPGKFQAFMEVVVDGALDMMDLVTGDRKKSMRVFPIVFGIFVFILINNWLGLVPGIGSISYDGQHIFRGGTADLNTTLALGLFSVIAANIFGVVVVGGWNYLNKFINLKTLLAIPGEIKKEPAVVLINPINFFVGLIEIISEFAKIASLSFRLFGNVFAGEVLLISISAIMAYGVPLPFMFLELIVGIVQALIFAVLTLVYFTIASTSHEH